MITAQEMLHWLNDDTLTSIADDLRHSLGYGDCTDTQVQCMLEMVRHVKECREP